MIYAYATFASGNGKVYSKGSKAFADNILNRFIELGGFIHFKSEVTNIKINNHQVESITINNNEIINADKFIFTANPKILFDNLIDKKFMPTTLKEKYLKKDINPIYSSYHTAYKIKKKHNIFNDTTILEIEPIKVGTNYITRLMIKDYTYLYQNKSETVIQAFIIQDEEDYYYWLKLHNTQPDKYNKIKNEIAEKIKNELIKHYPTLEQSIQVIDSWTPYTYTKYYNSYLGSYMGFTFTKKSSFKDIPIKLKGIKNLYLLTFWQRICGGLPVSLDLAHHIKKVIK